MATHSVATKKQNADVSGSTHDLWLSSGRKCVTVKLDQAGGGFPPTPDVLFDLHESLTGLGKAVEAIANLLEGGEVTDMWSTGLALNGLADAIVLHASLAEGVSAELTREPSLSEIAA